MNLAELPWDECVLPSIDQLELQVKHSSKNGGIVVTINTDSLMVASRSVGKKGDKWRIYSLGATYEFVEHVLRCKNIVDEFIERESSKPRLPKTKAPEGYSWTIAPDGKTVCLSSYDENIGKVIPVYYVPESKEECDCLEAIVAAFKEINLTKDVK